MVLGHTSEPEAVAERTSAVPADIAHDRATNTAAATNKPMSMTMPAVAAFAAILVAVVVATAAGNAIPAAPSGTPAGVSPLASSVTFVAPNGIRLAATRLPGADEGADEWLYYWHPNATDPEAVVEVHARPVRPFLVLDTSGSMGHYGFSEPSYGAAVRAAMTLDGLGEAQKHATQGENTVRDAIVVTFSSGPAQRLQLLLRGPNGERRTPDELASAIRRAAVAGGTRPETAISRIRDELASLGTDAKGADVPIVLLTDGEFNGQVSRTESWAPYVAGLKQLSADMDVRLSLHVLGLKADSLEQVQAMGRAFKAAGIPFAYTTMSGADDMAEAFAAAARAAMRLSGQSDATLTVAQDAVDAAAPEVRSVTVGQGQPVVSFFRPERFATLGTAAPVVSWDAAPLVAAEYFTKELAEDEHARHRAVAAAMRLFADATRHNARLRTHAVEVGQAAEVSAAGRDAVASATESVAAFGRRAAEVLTPFTVVRRRCGDGALGPAVCGDPDALVADQSAVVGWVQSALAELSVTRSALSAAADASRSRKARFEESNNRAGDTAFAAATANATLEAALTTATESVVSATASATPSASQTLSASDVVRALVDNL